MIKEKNMAKWGEIKTKISKTTNKVVTKTGEVADIAAKHVKLKSIEGKITEKYEELGRYYYKQLKTEQDQSEKMAAIVIDVDKLIVDRKDLKNEIAADKQRRAELKAERKNEKAQNNAPEAEDAEAAQTEETIEE
jgi:hypothetical protein